MGNQNGCLFPKMNEAGWKNRSTRPTDESAAPMNYYVVLLGLEGCGKTSLLQALAKEESNSKTQPLVPPPGWNVETLTFHNHNVVLTAWDVPVHDSKSNDQKLWPLWKYYFAQAHALVWVIDASSIEARIDGSLKELNERILPLFAECRQAKVTRNNNNQSYDKIFNDFPLLLLCNKQDLPGSVLVEDIVPKLKDEIVERGQHFLAVGCSVRSPASIHEGFHWLNKILTQQQQDQEQHAL